MMAKGGYQYVNITYFTVGGHTGAAGDLRVCDLRRRAGGQGSAEVQPLRGGPKGEGGGRNEKGEMVMETTLGKRIAALRRDKGLKQDELAQQLGVTPQAVSKWETGTADPSTSNLLALAKLFGVSAEELLRQVDRTDAEEN